MPREISVVPEAKEIEKRLSVMATQTNVANSFGVSRTTIRKWINLYGIYPPRISVVRAAAEAKERLSDPCARVRFAQWLIDEGSVSVDYQPRFDVTYLTLIGTMIDSEALGEIARITGANVHPGKPNLPNHLPLQCLRIYGAKAYAYLEIILADLKGLKLDEAKLALAFFPRSGFVEGRHTTDEFLQDAWKIYAISAVKTWNKSRASPLSEEDAKHICDEWLRYRIRKARRNVERKLNRAQNRA